MVAYQGIGVRAAVVLAAFAIVACFGTSAHAQKKMLFVAVGDTARPPIGWVQFCEARPWECNVERIEPRDVQYTTQARRELDRINRFVNDRIKPMTDQEHYGVVEKWTYPEDGYGDC
ncbi:MAG: transglutaminase-like cysteine peptidase, partial [Xanthobacteraceae bacterium]|nr:transglutaminase-like cysteine peptidase [Xanthobacteraceae bacterium]